MNNAAPVYSHRDATSSGVGLTVDGSSFTSKSSVEILITGTALVKLEVSNDADNPSMWVNANSGSAGYTETVFLAIPENVTYFRTNIVSISSGIVSSCFGRGIAGDQVLSAQHPVVSSTGAQ